MHEEDRERGKTNIGHFVLAIGAGPPVRQVRTAVAQRPDELFKVIHMVIDSEICRFGNPKKIAQIDKIRIAGTISMQVVKNLFLWQDKSLLRKGLELSITPLMEFIWPKRRILEVYLNIAEWAPGVFGAERAAQHHFERPARRLNARQAALLAASLPNPKVRRAGRPGPKTRRKARVVQARARGGARVRSCLGPLASTK